MNRSVAGAWCAVVVLTWAVGARGQLLVNGDLELPLDEMGGSDVATGWTLVEPEVDGMGMAVDTASFEFFGNHTPGGDRGLWLKSFEGGLGGDAPFTVDATLYQDVAGQPGQMYELSAWFKYEEFYSGLDPAVGTQMLLALDFLDGVGGSLVTSVELDIDTVQAGDGVWRQFSVDAISPAGTGAVRARVSMVDGVLANSNPQSAFVDDFSLVPGAGTSGLLALGGLVAVRRRR